MRLFLAALALLAGLGCREGRARDVTPTLQAEVDALDFGAARVGDTVTRTVRLTAVTPADVQLTQVEAEGEAFSVVSPPTEVPGLSAVELTLAFSPRGPGETTGAVRVRSDDPEHPEVSLSLTGRGVTPRLVVDWQCAPDCAAALTADAVEFEPTPALRLRPVDVARLPRLVVRAEGEVAALVTKLLLTGDGFSFVGNATIPATGLRLAPGTSQSVPVIFQPTAAMPSWSGSVEVEGDAPPRTWALRGALRDNQPPTACARLAQLVAPATPARDLQPGEQVLVPPGAQLTLSGFASADDTTCTTDPEDGRVGLTWRWTVAREPSGSAVTIDAADTPTPRVTPVALGQYTLALDVTDAQGHAARATVDFEVSTASAVTAQLDWAGAPLVDLDLHLVRPGAQPFSVPGDVSGATRLSDDGGHDWSAELRFDDTGDGPLVETITLDAPSCDAGACRYDVYVHGFRDRRLHTPAPTCQVDATCLDGEPCSCLNGEACVADEAPADAGATGTGRCLPSTPATVKLFLGSASTATLTVPLVIGAPCQLERVASVTWTDGGYSVAPASGVARYGTRAPGSLQCAPAWVPHPR